MARTNLAPIQDPDNPTCGTSRSGEDLLHGQYVDNFKSLADHGELLAQGYRRYTQGWPAPFCGSSDRLYKAPSGTSEILINIPIEMKTLRPANAQSGTTLDQLVFRMGFSINNIPLLSGGSGNIRGRVQAYLTVNTERIDLYQARETNDAADPGNPDEVAFDATTGAGSGSQRIRYEEIQVIKDIPDSAMPLAGVTADGVLTLRYYDFLNGASLSNTDSRGDYMDLQPQSATAVYLGIDWFWLKLVNDWT